MFLSIPDDEIFQAELSNIENIINLLKYANEMSANCRPYPRAWLTGYNAYTQKAYAKLTSK
jgi:hypothetical protein